MLAVVDIHGREVAQGRSGGFRVSYTTWGVQGSLRVTFELVSWHSEQDLPDVGS